MILDQTVTVPVPPERIWSFMMDVRAMGLCVPGVESIEQRDGDRYAGALRVRVGPIAVRLEGIVTVTERNADAWRARMQIEVADRNLRGAVSAKSTLHLRPVDAGRTEITVHTDAAVLGKLGEFGQSIMRRKADQILAEFVENMARAIQSAEGETASTGDSAR